MSMGVPRDDLSLFVLCVEVSGLLAVFAGGVWPLAAADLAARSRLADAARASTDGAGGQVRCRT
jgi:hypothetical protein